MPARRCRPSVEVRRGLREGLNLSRAQVAQALGVSPSTAGGWESGRDPSGEVREKYAYFLDGARTRPRPVSLPRPRNPQPLQPPPSLHYLTRTDHARSAAREAGLTVTDRTLKAWLEGRRSPSKRNLEKIETAYWTVRRQNGARYLVGRLNARGRGTRVELHPLNQSQVDRPRQRVVEFRTLNIRHWDLLVEAWSTGDTQGFDDAWTDQIVDLGSQWGQYEYVTNVGFAA